MVILSAGAAEEFFKKHDFDFADRFVNVSMKSHEFYKSSMALGAYSSYWRTLKRICTVQLFSNKRINETVLIRQKCVDTDFMGYKIPKGRRICPDVLLSHRMLPLILGSLLHHFDWESVSSDMQIDMRETFGLQQRN
ncbi:hypothetical protein POM88_024081 [Heracleum sosnowskyi]|uniref:Cytochrome P450 n=1 Tax=Heracleum sosnowskyi TaxID=360622 RepID=A0AAD8IIU3_9APIA|nr:hypothetical protein POM88_024081 [Heracleum sosnowskyi]